MPRPIDAYAAIDMIDEWLDSVGTVMVGKGLSSYGELIGCIEDTPTLTPPNEIPPCYQPDGDGCAYQCYDGQDEPIDKCKECPLCYSDKQRHHAPPNEPLTPCDVCRFSPPSSGDGKPCCLCPADRRPPEGAGNA